MTILSVETTSLNGSVAVFDGSQLLSFRVWKRQKSHSEVLTSEVQAALFESGKKIADIEGLALDVGPGSFTGIRVGLNFVKSLAYARSLPVFVQNSLNIIAEPACGFPGKVLSIVDAQRNSVYAAIFSGGKCLQEPTRVTFEDLKKYVPKKCLCLGEGYLAIEGFVDDELRTRLIRKPEFDDAPTAKVLGEIANREFLSVSPLDWKALQPLYIRSSAAEEKLKD